MGFAAVPALIEHLDDERLTRSVSYGFDNFFPYNYRVKDVVSDLLQELAGEDLGKDHVRRLQGWSVERPDAQAWWDKAQKVGEEAYLLEHVFPADKESMWLSNLMLEIISQRYPQHLPTIYLTILDERPKMQSWPIAEKVSQSSMPVDKQRELFLYAANHKNLLHCRSGLQHLQKLDPAQFLNILLDRLDSLPKTPTHQYWGCPESGLAHLVMQTNDAKAWTKLEIVANRSDVGLRMEFLSTMHRYNGEELDDQQRRLRLTFLAAFLKDSAAPNPVANPKMFEGPHASFPFKRLEVRNMAAMRIASILGFPEEPDDSWTPKQWENLRNKVKEGLKK
jgi:hypothetical protein